MEKEQILKASLATLTTITTTIPRLLLSQVKVEQFLHKDGCGEKRKINTSNHVVDGLLILYLVFNSQGSWMDGGALIKTHSI